MAYSEHIREATPITANCAIVTLSDTRTIETDKSGARIRELINQAKHLVTAYHLIRDEPSAFNALLDTLLQRDDVDVIFSTGGTGISRRDSTIDVVDQRASSDHCRGSANFSATSATRKLEAAAMPLSRAPPAASLPASSCSPCPASQCRRRTRHVAPDPPRTPPPDPRTT